MDGNRRYAVKNSLEKKVGYKLGMEQFLNFVKYQVKHNIYETSYYALSTENLKNRDSKELKIIGEIISNFFKEGEDIEKFFEENKIKIEIKGDINELKKKESLFSFNENKFITKLNDRFEKYNLKLNEIKFKVNICMNYGGQREIVDSFKKIIDQIEKNEIKKEDVNEDLIKKNIYFNSSPAPEIIVRPGDAPRISGFLLWDSQYSEIYLTKKFWPELDENDFLEIIEWYKKLKRNFGK